MVDFVLNIFFLTGKNPASFEIISFSSVISILSSFFLVSASSWLGLDFCVSAHAHTGYRIHAICPFGGLQCTAAILSPAEEDPKHPIFPLK